MRGFDGWNISRGAIKTPRGDLRISSHPGGESDREYQRIHLLTSLKNCLDKKEIFLSGWEVALSLTAQIAALIYDELFMV
jgi:hypothetical protein